MKNWIDIEFKRFVCSLPLRLRGLRVEQVALTNLRSGQVFDGPLMSDAEFVTADPDRARAVAYEQHVTAKIRQALAFIPGVFVEVNASCH